MIDRIRIGKIKDAHGIKGFVKIQPYGDEIDLLDGLCYTKQSGDEQIEVTIKSSTGKMLLAAIKGVNDRNAAEALKQTELWANRDLLTPISDDEFYIEDLIGLTAHTKDGSFAGNVITVQNFGAGDLLEIKNGESPSFYLPFTKACVPEINDDNIIVDIPEGLI